MDNKAQLFDQVIKALDDLYRECVNDDSFNDFLSTINNEYGVISKSLDELSLDWKEIKQLYINEKECNG
jgi:hypothetical protein